MKIYKVGKVGKVVRTNEKSAKSTILSIQLHKIESGKVHVLYL